MEERNLTDESKFQVSRWWIWRWNISNGIIAILAGLNMFLVFQPPGEGEGVSFANDYLYIQRTTEGVSFVQTLSFKNIGEKPITIVKVEGLVKSKDADNPFEQFIQAKYIVNTPQPILPFIQFMILPSEEFIYDIKMIKEPDRIVRDSAAILHTLLVDEFENGTLTPKYVNQGFRPSKKLGGLIDKFARSRTANLKSGLYDYILEVWADNEDVPIFKKCYSFYVSPENIFVINEAIKDYKKFSIQPIAYRPSALLPLTLTKNGTVENSLSDALKKYQY